MNWKLPYRVLSLDIGRSLVKSVCGPYQDSFRSVIAEDGRELQDVSLGKQDILMEYGGKVYWGGDLAERESDYPIRNDRLQKANERAKVLAVMAMHRMVSDGERIVVVTFQPIVEHNEANKEKLRKLLLGKYTVVVNGVTKSWEVVRVEVAAEGAIAVWAFPDASKVCHVIDGGSVTTNCATCVNRGMVGRLSTTYPTGCETVQSLNYKLYADSIYQLYSLRVTQTQGPVYVIGGRAEQLQSEFQRYYPNVIVPTNPLFATALGGYIAGVRMLEKEATETATKG